VTVSTNEGEAPYVIIQARKDEALDVTLQERLKCEAPLVTMQAHESDALFVSVPAQVKCRRKTFFV
jgi:hypothetical protein